MAYRWPTDPPGKLAAHSISYQTHLQHLGDQGGGAAIANSLRGRGLNMFTPQVARAMASAAGLPANTGLPGAAPVAPAPTFAPDVAYNDALAIAHQNYVNALGGLDTQEAQTKYDYGFDNPANPFSKVNELKRQYLNQGRYIGNSLGARGQLYSSARTKALAANSRNQDKDYANLRLAYDRLLGQIGAQRTADGTAEQQAKLQALADAMSRQGVS